MNPRPATLALILATAAGYTADKPWTEPDYLADACLALYEAGIPNSSRIPYPNHPGLSYDCGRSYEEQ